MKKIYSHENRLMVFNAKNIVDAKGIETFVKNEFSQSIAGDIAPQDAWPELWVYADSDADAAATIIEGMSRDEQGVDWLCKQCNEPNDASFELCWNCGALS